MPACVRPGCLLLGLALTVTVAPPGSFAQSRDSSAVVALVGGTLWPDPRSAPLRDAVVLVRGSTIAAVGTRQTVTLPPGTEVVDTAGMTITAGFWNSHVHFLQRKWANAGAMPAHDLDQQLQAMLTRWGFTTVFETWSGWENTRAIRDRIGSGEVPGPRILSTGGALFGPGLEAPEGAWAALGFIDLPSTQTARVTDVEGAEAAARRLLDAGTDGVKLYAATPGRRPAVISEEAMRAAVTEAHRRRKPAFAHPSSATGLLAAVRSGVDIITHTTPQSGPWDADTIAAMTAARVGLIPTLKLWQYETRHEPFAVNDRFVSTAVGQLRAWHQAGGTVLFGTDVGYMSEYDPSEEYRLMESAGLGFREILAALTSAPAERFAAGTRTGQVRPGFDADLVAVQGDPSTDPRALARVQITMRGGRVVYREAPRAARN